MLQEKFAQRFNELVSAFASLTFHRNNEGMSGTHVKTGDWKRWATSVQSLILAVYGDSSPHYQNFISAFSQCAGYDNNILELQGIFLSAKDDFEGGYVFNVDLRISGEVFGDFVAAAKAALDSGEHVVSAVLACAALEDALKRYAVANGLEVEGKPMEDVVNALKSKSLVSGSQKGLLSAMPKIRNNAMHAQWEKITPQDAGSVIGFVEQFLLTNF
jgi:Domain of unknown function (DUF4145)